MREGKGECCADMAFSNPPILRCLRPRLGGLVAGKGSRAVLVPNQRWRLLCLSLKMCLLCLFSLF